MASRKKTPPEGAEKLAKYREIRDFGASPEPSGHEAGEASVVPTGDTRSGSFVVHMHSATRLHYDLRLERGGVLASFAVPHGPSLDPETKVLAIETEDHPIEYLDYEGVIPEGNYGAGPMICWDRGEVRYLETSAEKGHEDGKIDFVLSGYKLRGRFALVRLKRDEQALFYARRAVELAPPPGDPRMLCNLALLTASTLGVKGYDEAFTLFEKALALNPADPNARIGMTNILMERKQWARAEVM